MAWTSTISSKELVIGDATPAYAISPAGYGRGWEPRPAGEGFGEAGLAQAADEIPAIPRSEWKDRIEHAEESKTRLSDLARRNGLPCTNQSSTNYCWIFAPTYCVETVRVIQGAPHERLSPASVGCKIKRFRNVGGWGTEGLEYIVQNGVVPDRLWPSTAINRRYDTAQAWREAEKYKVTEWWDITPRDLEEMFSVLFAGHPIAVGYSWWGHEVTAYDPLYLGRDNYGVRIRNSWGMSWGDDGFSVLSGRKMLADDAVAPRVAIASSGD